MTQEAPGPSCIDDFRVMQHKLKLMLETFMHYTKEFGDEDNNSMVNAATLATSLTRSFNNMPYLVASSSSMNAMTNNHNNNGFFYCFSDDDYNVAIADSAGADGEEDQ
ncbi:hypothetical protein RIF29_13977 [Crotalaria pallida]|uniref:Uncharacterized protein n=1 Tax=Crotalaria pallida TaxID=3830 RepID=A0AAN9I9W1_CROPI